MSAAKSQVKIRPMAFSDLKAIFAIDKAIREVETTETYKEVTYRDFNTRKIFGMEESDAAEKPDILEVAKLIELGFVAELEGKPCGFVVGRQTYLIERETQEGEVAVISVHPDCQKNGIGGKLLNAILELFRSRGVDRVRMGIDPRDGLMQAFLENEGFSSRQRLYYTKKL